MLVTVRQRTYSSSATKRRLSLENLEILARLGNIYTCNLTDYNTVCLWSGNHRFSHTERMDFRSRAWCDINDPGAALATFPHQPIHLSHDYDGGYRAVRCTLASRLRNIYSRQIGTMYRWSAAYSGVRLARGETLEPPDPRCSISATLSKPTNGTRLSACHQSPVMLAR